MPRPAVHPGEILAEELAEIAVTPTEHFLRSVCAAWDTGRSS